LEDQSIERLRERAATLGPEARAELPDALRARLVEIETALERTSDDAQKYLLAEYDAALTDASNLTAQAAAQRERVDLGIEHILPQRRWHKILGVIAGSAFVSWALAIAPGSCVDSARKDADACFEQDPTDGTGCGQSVELFWPKLLPWSRERAVNASRSIDRRVGERELARVTAYAPDAAARTAVAKDVSATGDAEIAARILHDGGDYAALAALADDGGTGYALQAAVTLGDLDRVRELARTGATSYESTLRRGGWLCLLGDRPAGLALLQQSDADYRSQVSSNSEGWVKARLGALACADTPAAAGFPPLLVPSYGVHAAERIQLFDPEYKKGRRWAWAERLLDDSGTPRIAGVALAITHGPRDLPAVLALVSPAGRGGLGLGLEDITAPYALLRPREVHESAIAPAWLEEAAGVLEGMMAGATPFANEPSASDGPSPEAAADPATTLRRGAWKLWLASAAVHARDGRHDAALAALARADAIAEDELRWLSAAAHLAARDAEGAEKVLAPFLSSRIASAGPIDRMVGHFNHAWALLALGRSAEALAAAQQAHKASLERDREADTEMSAVWQRAGVSPISSSKQALRSAWLLAALMLREGAVGPIEGLPSASSSPPDSSLDSPYATVAAWLHIAQLPEDQKPRARAGAEHLLFYDEAREALPAVLYVVGRAAPDTGVEVWLDRMVARWALEGNDAMALRPLLRARAEAARWRGDEAAAAKWQKRADSIAALVVGPKEGVLAQVVGL
jgi:tetratricopeptide (TPR) repeat protein